MGLKKDFTPCKFNDPEVWARGIVDLLVINGDKARIIDYKTSKSSQYADTKQLELLALLTFKHFPEIKTITGDGGSNSDVNPSAVLSNRALNMAQVFGVDPKKLAKRIKENEKNSIYICGYI